MMQTVVLRIRLWSRILWKHDLEIAEICCANDRFLSKMTPRLHAESTGMTLLGRWMVGLLSLESYFVRPKMRNSIHLHMVHHHGTLAVHLLMVHRHGTLNACICWSSNIIPVCNSFGSWLSILLYLVSFSCVIYMIISVFCLLIIIVFNFHTNMYIMLYFHSFLEPKLL